MTQDILFVFGTNELVLYSLPVYCQWAFTRKILKMEDKWLWICEACCVLILMTWQRSAINGLCAVIVISTLHFLLFISLTYMVWHPWQETVFFNLWLCYDFEGMTSLWSSHLWIYSLINGQFDCRLGSKIRLLCLYHQLPGKWTHPS